MSSIEVDSAREIGDRLHVLSKKITEFLCDSGYAEEDARYVALNNIILFIVSALMRMSVLVSLDDGVITEEKIREVFRIWSGDLRSILNEEMKVTKIVFVTLFQFQVENLFRILLSQLDNQSIPDTYNTKVKRLLKILDLNTDDKRDKLNVLAYVRNCLHSNGIHSKKNKTFVIDGCSFNFVKGKSFEHANWGEIHYMTNSAFEVIKEILGSDRVKQIPQPLLDQYNSDNNNS